MDDEQRRGILGKGRDAVAGAQAEVLDEHSYTARHARIQLVVAPTTGRCKIDGCQPVRLQPRLEAEVVDRTPHVPSARAGLGLVVGAKARPVALFIDELANTFLTAGVVVEIGGFLGAYQIVFGGTCGSHGVSLFSNGEVAGLGLDGDPS
jgi:hypothetical protein